MDGRNNWYLTYVLMEQKYVWREKSLVKDTFYLVDSIALF